MLAAQRQHSKMSGAAAEIFYLPLFTILSILISYLAVSIVLTKLSNTGILNVKDHGNWVNFVSASQRNGFFSDTTLANKIIYVNLNQYTSGWETGFPFFLFDPTLVTEGTSLTIYNSPTSSVGSTLRILFANQADGVAPYTDSETCGTKCPCPTNTAFCGNGNCPGNDCSQCLCTSVCNPKVNLHFSATLGRGQGVTVVVQRRIPNVNLSQQGSCFYIDLTPQELQPRDWVPVKYYNPDIVNPGEFQSYLNCSGYNNYSGDPDLPVIIQPINSSDTGHGDPAQNLCYGYTLNSNTTFCDNIPSAFNGNHFRQNGPYPSGTAKYDYQWQDCMAVDCKCVSPKIGIYCETPP
jgi:hypothetical protein